MNITVVFSIFSFISFSVAAAVLVSRQRFVKLDLNVFIPLLLAILLYDFIVFSNFLEHSQISAYLDPLEDIAEIVFTLIFLFFINNWRKGRSEARFRALFKQAPLPLAEVTRDGHIVEVNDALAQKLHELHSITADQIQNLEKWWDLACPDPEYRTWATESWDKRVTLAYGTGKMTKPEEVEVTCKDETRRTLLVGASIIGENLAASFVDITDRIEAEVEKEKLKEQLLQSQKLEAIGTLAGGVAHDFNNMLGAIVGFAELTMDQLGPDHPFRKNLDHILEASRRSEGLIRQLMTFARKQQIVPTVFDVNSAISSILKMLRRLIGENIELECVSYQGTSMIKMDPTQFDQILINLCINAKDAISHVGSIRVETSMAHIDEAQSGVRADCAPGKYVLISISDNGCGMSQETLEHIYEPFFTTKGLGRGTGLGLATVYGIVKQAGGAITVDSEPGVGTTFKIYLPQYLETDTQSRINNGGEMPMSKGETVLIVEDDSMVLEMGSVALQRLGYQTLRARTAGEAIRIVESDSTQIDILITDVVMPEMNGKELAEKLTEIRPGIKYLFMSGYTDDIIDKENILQKKVSLINKPFAIRDFAEKIREVLDGV